MDRYDLAKIFKSLSYLPPAVPIMLVALLLTVAQTLLQSVRAAKWFLKVVEVGFRFTRATQLLEFIRLVIKFRR